MPAPDDDVRPEVERFLRDRARALDGRAGPVDASELSGREVRAPRANVRSALAAAAVIALVIGSAAGFAIGRASAPKKSTTVTASSTPRDATSSAGGSAGVAKALPGSGYGAPMTADAPMTRVFDRTTSEGVVMHAFTQTQPAGGCPAGSWCPPAECYGTSFLAELANSGAVGMMGAPAYPADGPASLVAPVQFGHQENTPATGTIVRATDVVHELQATWPDGFVDSMAPVDGWAVLVHNGVDVPVVRALDANGTVVATLDGAHPVYAQMPAECQPPPPPPPTLPPAGAEQPDDVAGATDAVRTAYTTVFTNHGDPSVNATLVQDSENLQPAFDAVKQNFPQATDTVTVDVGEIRFLSKTEAALLFELKYSGGAQFGQQIGYAELIDGTWKISRDTMCMVLGWGGGVCDPPPDPSRAGGGAAVRTAPTATPAN